MNNSNFKHDDEMEDIKSTDEVVAGAEPDKTSAQDELLENFSSDPLNDEEDEAPSVFNFEVEADGENTDEAEKTTDYETDEATADKTESSAEDTDEVPDVPVTAASKAVHQTAAAAISNIEGEEVDIRRQKPRKETKIKKTKVSYERKKQLYGYGFIGIWIVGIIYMFIIPIIQSIWYSLCYTELVGTMADAAAKGMAGPGIFTEWNDFGNYRQAFVSSQEYLPKMAESLGGMAPQTIMILIFSLFIAVLLNQKFKGRTFARAIFFLPVLIATGPVIAVIKGDILANGVADASQFSTLFETNFVDELLNFLGIYNLNQQVTETIKTITSDIFNLVWSAGIQILIFLAALQSIPASAREAASMEGATGWEFFWKITFPTISPMILANLIYTVIDAFVDSENPVMKMVIVQSKQLEYGISSAYAWIYFVIIGVVLAIVAAIASKFVFYEVD